MDENKVKKQRRMITIGVIIEIVFVVACAFLTGPIIYPPENTAESIGASMPLLTVI